MKIKIGKLKNKKLLLIIGGVILLVGVVLTLLLVFGVFDKKDEKASTGGSGSATKVPEPTEEKKVTIVNEESTSRPYAVMINNISTARPYQSGLQDAYIVYELIAEGGITRFMALFLDQNTARVGSIRSARHYYLDYALENDAIFVHHGQSPQAKSDFSKLNLDRIVVASSGNGWREKLPVSSEHTLFTSIEKLDGSAKNKRSERNKDLLLNYSAEEVDLTKIEGAKTANNVAITYSSGTTSKYEYDAENKVYKRFVNSKEHIDYQTKEQYMVKNIITYQVENYTAGTKGRQDLENIGSGSGYYISNGIAVPIKWTKDSRSAQTVYKYANGEEIVVNDGNTFIQIQPKGQSLNITE